MNVCSNQPDRMEWWNTYLIPAVKRQRQADHQVWGQLAVHTEFEPSQSYIVKPSLREKNKQTNKTATTKKKPSGAGRFYMLTSQHRLIRSVICTLRKASLLSWKWLLNNRRADMSFCIELSFFTERWKKQPKCSKGWWELDQLSAIVQRNFCSWELFLWFREIMWASKL